ncbi:MAG: hypothetical protein DRJ03_21520 [Chloroflexi bacterium]|nr:MAG: hypothetical protein DRJ03_21520 [Chloroflexota bacterium]
MVVEHCYPTSELLFPSTSIFPTTCPNYLYQQFKTVYSNTLSERLVYRVGATAPYLFVRVVDENNEPMDLSLYYSAQFFMFNDDGFKVENGDAVVSTRFGGGVFYRFDASDLDTPGSFFVYFKLYSVYGDVLVIPDQNTIIVDVVSDGN